MTRLLVRADTIITMDPRDSSIDRGAVIVDGGRIEAVGSQEELTHRGPFEREIGGAGFVLLPGLVTCHNHTAEGPVIKRTYLRTPFDFERFEPVTMYMGNWSEEDLYWVNLYMNIQHLKNGTTGAISFFYGVADHPELGTEPVIRAFLDSGMRVALGIAARDRWDLVHARDKEEFLSRLPSGLRSEVEASPFGYLYDTDQVEALSRTLADRYRSQERFRIFACPDWTTSSSDELYGRMKNLAEELDTGILTHLLETPFEMLHSFRTYGKSAVARLNDLGFLGSGVVCTDCNWLTEEDVKILADTGATAVYSPWHIMRFNGIAPVGAMIDAGVPVAFSIALSSQNDGYDTLSDLAISEHLQHVPSLSSRVLSAPEILRMATANGGRAWALDDSLGSIEVGKRADLVLLEASHLYGHPFVDPDCDVHRLVVYRGRGQDVHTVVVGGEIVVEAGRYLGTPEDEVFERAKSAALRMAGEQGPVGKWIDLSLTLEPYVTDYYSEWQLQDSIAPWGAYNARRVLAHSDPARSDRE